MRRETSKEREQWTALIEGRAPVENKYGNERSKRYASKHEADIAMRLHALAKAGKIRDLREQHRIYLVNGNGRLRPITYIADFHYIDEEGKKHVLDAKGYKTQVYRLKKRLAALLLGIEIEEV